MHSVRSPGTRAMDVLDMETKRALDGRAKPERAEAMLSEWTWTMDIM
jgi:hypothetical protein